MATQSQTSSMESLEENGTEQEHNHHEEIEDDLNLNFLSESQINTLLEQQDVDEIQRIMEEFLNFKDTETNLKEAILVDYYVSALCWGREQNFSSLQLTEFIGLLHFLMENIESKHLSLAENMRELVRALTGIRHCVEEAKDIIDYLTMSLFQHHKLYECMFTLPREQKVIGAEVVVEVPKPAETPFPVPLEEGVPYEIYKQFLSPMVPEENIKAEINDN